MTAMTAQSRAGVGAIRRAGGPPLAKREYAEQSDALRVVLLELQEEIGVAQVPVIIQLAGFDRPGCNELLDLLYEWMDPHYLHAEAFGPPSTEEQLRPMFWRYWGALPRRGRIGIFLRPWLMQSLGSRVLGYSKRATFRRELDHICRFERALVEDGYLLVKVWVDTPRAELKKRLTAAAKDPLRAWRVEKQDRMLYRRYRKAHKALTRALEQTSVDRAPWHVVESLDRRRRNVTVAQIVIQALVGRLKRSEPRERRVARRQPRGRPRSGPLSTIDLSKALSPQAYDRRLERLQLELGRLMCEASYYRLPTVLVFEGWDAAGKGGIIRRITAAMDPTRYRVIPVAAPSEEEQGHHYLWRFWRHVPRAGHVAIFDRSWYGRVLVERVEGFARPAEWRRAYEEINDFEAQLVERGAVVMKFWAHIDPDEQLERFKARERTAHKRYKITREDYRNRSRWGDYEAAANEMIQRTSRKHAPWHLIASNDKRWARVEVLRHLVRHLSRALDRLGAR